MAAKLISGLVNEQLDLGLGLGLGGGAGAGAGAGAIVPVAGAGASAAGAEAVAAALQAAAPSYFRQEDRVYYQVGLVEGVGQGHGVGVQCCWRVGVGEVTGTERGAQWFTVQPVENCTGVATPVLAV